MTDHAELIERLRDCANGVGSLKSAQGDFGLCDDAADRIAALVAERDRYRRTLQQIAEGEFAPFRIQVHARAALAQGGEP